MKKHLLNFGAVGTAFIVAYISFGTYMASDIQWYFFVISGIIFTIILWSILIYADVERDD